MTSRAASMAAAGRRFQRYINTGCTLLVLVVSLLLFSAPLRHEGRMLAYAQDDFYYYLTIARNLAAGHGSTFDGTTLTNGYHPLYFLLLLGVAAIDSSLRAAYTAMWMVDVASAVAIFAAVRILVARRTSNLFLSNGLALGMVALAALRIQQQMEVTIAMPLGLLLLVLLDRAPVGLTAGRWFAIGLLGSLLVLSRLDAVLLVMLCVTAVFSERAYRRELTWAKVAAFVTGFVPLLAVYVAVNQHYFHRLTPISGAAKQARHGIGLFLPAIRDSLSAGADVMFAAAFCALCLLPVLWKHMSASLRVLSVSMLLFPFVHFGANFLLSDWMVFPWYRYSLIFSSTAVVILFAVIVRERMALRAQRALGGVALVCGVCGLLAVRYKPDPMMADIADAAYFVRNFEATHPGRYAMGDRAGMVGYITQYPLVQLEGLVMDDKFLNLIRQEGDIGDALRLYHVDYYIAFDWRQKKNWPDRTGCFHAKEPNNAGSSSPALMDDFCDAPVAEYMAPSGRTIIFDVRGADKES